MRKTVYIAALALLMLPACTSGSFETASGDPFSYYDQKDWNVYYWSKSCSATLCNPR